MTLIRRERYKMKKPGNNVYHPIQYVQRAIKETEDEEKSKEKEQTSENDTEKKQASSSEKETKDDKVSK